MSHRPRKRFGQHFLRDPAVVSRILAAVAPAPGETIVEIGPGQGVLTRPLAAQPISLHAVELDRDLAAALDREFRDSASVSIHQGDALDFDFAALGDELRLIGNLPYNISTPLLFRLIDCRRAVRDMHFMLQKEVVDRMAASPGTKQYGRLTVMLSCFMEVVPLFDVPPEAFTPPPRVRSAVVRLVPRDASFAIEDPGLFGSLVAAAFSKRRKTLRNALADWLPARLIEEEGVDPSLRPENLTAADFARLAARALRERRDTLE